MYIKFMMVIHKKITLSSNIVDKEEIVGVKGFPLFHRQYWEGKR
jgi:hypothetical protein